MELLNKMERIKIFDLSEMGFDFNLIWVFWSKSKPVLGPAQIFARSGVVLALEHIPWWLCVGLAGAVSKQVSMWWWLGCWPTPFTQHHHNTGQQRQHYYHTITSHNRTGLNFKQINILFNDHWCPLSLHVVKKVISLSPEELLPSWL